ncbi:hypothetical protein GGI42DRAFT_253344 [Trichoderma sp. SZMC 28013]
MAKRQSDDSALLPRKKAKLHAVHDDDNPNTHALHSPPPPPLTLAGFERREKRKRSLDSQPDTSEEPKTKQARKSQSPEESSDTDLPWPCVESDEDDDKRTKKAKQARRSQGPEESSDTDLLYFELRESDDDDEPPSTSSQPDTSEEPKTKQAHRSQSPEESSDTDLVKFRIYDTDEDDHKETKEHPWQEFCRQSTREAKEYLSTVRTCRCRNHQARILSPGLSDEDTSGEDTSDEDVADEGATGSNYLRPPIIPLSAIEYMHYPQPIAQKQSHTSRTIRKRDTTDDMADEDTSDEDTADEDVANEGATGSNQLGFPTIHPSAMGNFRYLQPIAQEQPDASRTLRKRDTTTPQRKRRQPLKKVKGESKQNKSRDKAIEAFLSSKRSSRRNRDCTLWQLGDDGMARTVSIAR